MARDEFSHATKETLARRVAYHCSNTSCRALTSGPHSESDRYVNIGVASHITAASAGGPRFDSSLSPLERITSDNGIWLCQSCAKLIDSDDIKYTVAVLAGWKVAAEQRTSHELIGIPEAEFFPQAVSVIHTPIPRVANLTYDDARALLIKAGWQPRLNHWTHADNPDIKYGNGLHYWNKGYHEIRHASGTGLAFCSFGFEDVYGHKLVLITAGEVIEDVSDTVLVWRWYFEKEDGHT
jgi:hypothetical protein